jgi:hypothetical protein
MGDACPEEEERWEESLRLKIKHRTNKNFLYRHTKRGFYHSAINIFVEQLNYGKDLKRDFNG